MTPGPGASLTIFGGAGNDVIDGSNGDDLIDGGDGDDTLRGCLGDDTIDGGMGNDFLDGEEDNDILTGGVGNDTYAITGLAQGNDTINEATGCIEQDALDFSGYGAGVTVDIGLTTPQLLNGGDTTTIQLSGATAIENVIGSAFADDITGSDCDNTLSGGAGDDTIDGANGNDVMNGEAGNDLLVTNPGDDTMDGGVGNDTYQYGQAGDQGSDVIAEAGGCIDLDRLDFSNNPNPVTVDIELVSLQLVSTNPINITLQNGDSIEEVVGSQFADTIFGNACDNFIDGQAGNDTITARSNPTAFGDVIVGGDDNDLIIWNNGDGSDSIDGNNGDDTVQVNAAPDGDDFTLQDGGGGRSDLSRTNLTLFTLDIGTTETLDLNLGDGDDTFTMETPIPAPLDIIDVDGGNDNDLLEVDFTGSNTLPGTVNYVGGMGDDTVHFFGGGPAFATETYNPIDADTGAFQFNGGQVDFDLIELINQTKAATNLVMNLGATNDEINIVDGPMVDGFQTTQINGGLAPTFTTLNFANKSTLTINSGDGDDTFNVNNPNPANGLGQVNLNGENGNDVFNMTPGPVPYDLDGGDPTICPGDSLFIDFSGVTNPQLINVGPGSGTWTFDPPAADIDYVNIEDVPGVQIIAVSRDFDVSPRVRVFDAASKALLLDFDPYPDLPAFRGGVRVATGDVNGDCVPDIVTALGPGNDGTLVRVFDGFSARNGIVTQVASFNAFGSKKTGVFVAVGDLDRDGFGEIITSIGGPAKTKVKIFDGSSVVFNPVPTKIVNFKPFGGSFIGGATVATGDYDGNGTVDVIVATGPTKRARIKVFDGPSLFDGKDKSDIIDKFKIFDKSDKRGVYVTAVDTDGDGMAEIYAARNAAGVTQPQPFDLQIGTGLNIPPMVAGFSYQGFNSNGAVRTPDILFQAYPNNYTSGVRLGGWQDQGPGNILTGNGPGVPDIAKEFDAALTETIFAVFGGRQDGLFVAGSKRNDGIPVI